ncbi:peptidoglycan DD-metalloendopeptidase family protein [Cellulophaga sp. HaHaR_3_176]|uniref:M23 family metallopeptidase n=1 Tax=Cellulophaga sp. HaHaR_3_176 TaxID=1942464 RepID=UPI001C1F25C3|nr:peptidoglycan DD-metalloendopeptidase family protein [Cellulophaga sp. HaHaR_3_176]QWX83384.1 peptidoglycan DD-metalloendopeptidase family protein [Cellulophaga sp. HaHaR_3_176]
MRAQKFCLGILSSLLLFSCGDKKTANEKIEKVEVIEKPVIIEAYGFNIADFEIVRDTVRNGDSFGELMLQNKVDYQKIFKVSTELKDTFDVRKIQIGKPYAILKSKDTTQTTQYFVYENDRINYTVVDLRDSVVAYRSKKNVKYVERVASGVITSNLSTAINEQGIDYMVTNNLSEIYAWSIDFFRLQKGDKFKVIYKEKYINDSIYAGAEPIEAAYFEHNGESFYGFEYQVDSLKNITEYYDDAAKNLRRTFLKAPVEFSRISSRFNLNRRIKYYGYKLRPHKGTDYAAPLGTPILATANGTVVESTRRGGNGKYVKIEHNGTYSTQYLHMKNQNVKKGDFVKQGDVIGWIGMTGNTGGPHVCYRFWKNGQQVDPLKEKLPAADPIVDSLRADYLKFINPIKTKLDNVEYTIIEKEEEQQITQN